MQEKPPQVLLRQGLDLLHQGEHLAARQAFEAALAQAPQDATTQMALAYACAGQRDLAAAGSAVDRVLALDPRSLRALLLKGELVLTGGDERAAAAFFQAALQVAGSGSAPPADLAQALQRAQAHVERLAGSFEQTVLNHLASSPVWNRQPSARFSMSLDLLLGKKQLYLQAPRLYCFPGLPHIQYFERSLFPWMDALEAATDSIRDELLAVMDRPAGFAPYLESDPSRPAVHGGAMRGSDDWTALYLWRNGEPVEPHASLCPRTMAALAELPLPRIPGRSPNILFSQLRPGARIPPHHGFVNTRLIVHLPLLVPPGCYFRVGNDTREWQQGKAWAFDDTIEHEAWNSSDQTRVVLLFEVWRPELTSEEQQLVTSLFEAIGRHQGPQHHWDL
jgi:aspartyl/asparaginyl beta-hydroxylase (cupin superfamily)